MELRCSESVGVFVPELEDDQLEEQVEWVKGLLEKGGAQLTEVENWGKKRLAYEIEKRREGYYFLFRFRSQGSLVEDLEKSYRLNGKVLRYLTVKRRDAECEKREQPESGEEG